MASTGGESLLVEGACLQLHTVEGQVGLSLCNGCGDAGYLLGGVMTMVMPVSWVLENETVYAYTRSP